MDDNDSQDSGELRSQFDERRHLSLEADHARASLRMKLFGQPSEQTQLGRFEIRSKLGSGGMGVVYEAIDPATDRRVAIKTLAGLEPQRLYRLKKEFRSLAEVSHPNLVELYELSSSGEHTFIVMELIDGVDFLKHARDTDEAGVRAAFSQLASAVSALHSRSKLHLDIKPANVLVTDEGHVKLLDFGLIRELRPDPGLTTVDGSIAGTPAYMSPEQAVDEKLTPASDWYGVGVMLYQVLTGKLPFAEREPKALLRAKQERTPDRPSSRASGVPTDLDDLCMRLLLPDPARRPPTSEVLQHFGAEAGEDVSPETDAFVGRADHEATLEQAFQDSTTGHPVTIFVHGDPGAGKTALVSRFLRKVTARRTVVTLAGRCYQHESVPYPGFDSLIDGLMRYLLSLPSPDAAVLMPRDIHALAQLFPVLLRVSAVTDAPRPSRPIADQLESRRRGFAALKELLARIADRQALVLFVDDLQWGDIDSARLLRDLRQPPDAPSMLCIGSYRSEGADSHPVLKELRAVPDTPGQPMDVRELPVGPLTPTEAEDLATHLLGRSDRTMAQTIAEESEGNPLFVTELVRHASSLGSSASRTADAPELSLGRFLSARIRGLSTAARRLLEIVAIAGGPLDRKAALSAASLSSDTHRAETSLHNAHLVRSLRAGDDNELECYHDRIRETVVAEMDERTFQDTHLAVADALESRRAAEPASLAMHLQAAGKPERALRYATTSAAQAAEALAFDRAAALYRLALDLVDHTPERRCELTSKLGHALANAGRGPEAADAYLAAVELATPRESLDLRLRAMAQLLANGHIDRGLAEMREVLTAVNLTFPTTRGAAVGSFVWHSSLLRVGGLRFQERSANEIPPEVLTRIDASWAVLSSLPWVDPARTWLMQARHVRLALRAGEPRRIANALTLYSWGLANLGRPRAQRVLALARSVAERTGDPYCLALTTHIEGVNALYLGQWKRALELCDRGAAGFREHGGTRAAQLSLLVHTTEAHANLASETALAWLGEIKQVRARVQRSIQSAAERGDLQTEVTRKVTRFWAFGWLAADDPERARQEVREAIAGWSRESFHVQHFLATQSEANISLYTGEALDAFERVDAQWESRALMHRSPYLRIWSWNVRGSCAVAAACQSPDPEPLWREAERAASTLEREDAPFGHPMAPMFRAAIVAAKRNTEAAVALLDKAAAGFDALDMHLFVASIHRQKGRLIGGDTGRELIASADAFMAKQDIREPEKMARLFTPGFDGG